MELILTKYTYQNVFARQQQVVRVYSQKEGANGRVVLEDIVEILLTTVPVDQSQKLSNGTNDAATVTQEKIQLSEISPIKYEGVHLADIEQLHEFYSFCDDLAPQEIYESLGDWLNFQVCSLIIKRLAYLGEMVSQIPFWEEYALKVSQIFNENERITIKDWLVKAYGLSVTWVITILTYKVMNMMSSAYTVNAGEKPVKNEDNVNTYYPKTFGFVAQRINLWISQDNWSWLREAINNSVAVKETLDKDKKQVRSLRKEGKSDDAIIESIWQVTPTSNLVGDKNYQYDISKAFVRMV